MSASRDPENKTQRDRRAEEIDCFINSVMRKDPLKDSGLTADDVESRAIDAIVAIANGKAREKDTEIAIGATAAVELAYDLQLKDDALSEVLKKLVSEGYLQEAQDFKVGVLEVERQSVVAPRNDKEENLYLQRMTELRKILNEAVDDAFSRRIRKTDAASRKRT